ncbi:hypothetical protein HBB16_12870 [Pseudonocardia sp. MCCB 268]|nr:hypothetical protein [Pseudonocardia cytotoxica]
MRAPGGADLTSPSSATHGAADPAAGESRSPSSPGLRPDPGRQDPGQAHLRAWNDDVLTSR